jgi:hypothetical protein
MDDQMKILEAANKDLLSELAELDLNSDEEQEDPGYYIQKTQMNSVT